MRNLTIGLIAFAVAFSICGIAFRSVTAANGKMGHVPASAWHAPAKLAPGPGGVPAVFDDELY
jgi:hypothetical protein